MHGKPRVFKYAIAISVGVVLAGCPLYKFGPYHTCDSSEAVSFLSAPDFIGRWDSNPTSSQGFGFEIDEDGEMDGWPQACAVGDLSPVVGDYNVFVPSYGAGRGYLRLLFARVTKREFEFVWVINSSNKEEWEHRRVMWGRLLSPGRMLYKSLTKSEPIIMYRLPDEVPDGSESEQGPHQSNTSAPGTSSTGWTSTEQSS